MPITTHRNPARDTTTFKCNGDLSFTEIIAVIERFSQGTIAPPTNKIIWDMQAASIDSITTDHVHTIAELVKGYITKAESTKIAVVISENIRFDIVKKFQAESKDVLRNLMIFRKTDEPIEWLEQE